MADRNDPRAATGVPGAPGARGGLGTASLRFAGEAYTVGGTDSGGVHAPARAQGAGRRATVGVTAALALHLVALYWLSSRTEPVALASLHGMAGRSITVSLVAAPPAQRVAEPRPPVPAHRAAPAPVKSRPVLVTHRTSPRVAVEQQKPQPAPDAPQAQPQRQAQSQPSAQAPATAASQPAAKVEAPAGDTGRELVLPKAIGAAALSQLGCHIPQPVYPPRARRLGEAGAVDVRVTIGVDGHLSDLQVVRSSRFPDLDQAALEALSAGRCEPYRQNGTPQAVTAVQAVSFNLDD